MEKRDLVLTNAPLSSACLEEAFTSKLFFFSSFLYSPRTVSGCVWTWLVVLIQSIDWGFGLISANFHTNLLFVVRMHVEPVNPRGPIDVLAAAAANISRCKVKPHRFIIERLGEQLASVSRA